MGNSQLSPAELSDMRASALKLINDSLSAFGQPILDNFPRGNPRCQYSCVLSMSLMCIGVYSVGAVSCLVLNRDVGWKLSVLWKTKFDPAMNEVELPVSLKSFMDAFDNMLYPDLVLVSEETG